MFTMCCFVGYCAMVTSCKALVFHPLQLHWFYIKSKRRAQSPHEHWRRSEVQYIKYIAWGTLQEMSPGVAGFILYIKQATFQICHMRETPVKNKIIPYKGIIVKMVIFFLCPSLLYISFKLWTTSLCKKCLEGCRWERITWNSSNCTTFLQRDCAPGSFRYSATGNSPQLSLRLPLFSRERQNTSNTGWKSPFLTSTKGMPQPAWANPIQGKVSKSRETTLKKLGFSC